MCNWLSLFVLQLISIEFLIYQPNTYKIGNDCIVIYSYALNEKINSYLKNLETSNLNKNLFCTGEIAFCLENDFSKNIGDTTSKTNIYGDIETYFILNYTNKNFYYNLKTYYIYELYYKLQENLTTKSDDFKISNSIGFINSDFLATSLSIDVNTPLFNRFEDSVLMFSFLSPAQIMYSLNIEFKKKFSNNTLIELGLGLACIKSTLIINKDIYNIEDRFGIIDKKLLSNSIGFKFNYLIWKEWQNSFTITNSGDIYFPSKEKPFSKEWFKTLTISLENDLTILNKKGFKISLISNFKYNKFELQTFEMHHKLYCSITIKK
ncbi:MAG: hypothetical protein ACOX4D_01595 [Bacteroidales bacterium]